MIQNQLFLSFRSLYNFLVFYPLYYFPQHRHMNDRKMKELIVCASCFTISHFLVSLLRLISSPSYIRYRISSSEICKHYIEKYVPQKWRSFVTKGLIAAQKFSASCSHFCFELPVDILSVVNKQCK